MGILKFIVKILIFTFLQFFKLLPINSRKVYFTSFLGRQVSCNPKYLYLAMLNGNLPRYTYVWELKNQEKKDFVPDAKIVYLGSLDRIFELMTSKYIITNTEFPWYIPLKRKQILLQTWHGGGAYKKVGIAVGRGKLGDLEQKLNSRQITYYISSSAKFTEVQSLSKSVPKIKFINTGMPRNAILLKDNNDIRKEILNNLGITNEDLHFVLYAPTYRGNPGFKSESVISIDLDFVNLLNVLTEKFQGKWMILYRGHYYDSCIKMKNNVSYIDVTKYDDMQELLIIADVLITDYSSSMWDFSLTRKPCFLFVPDIDNYIRTRAFYTEPETWPFPIAKNNIILSENIKKFDKYEYEKNIKQHWKNFSSYESPNACEKVLKSIGIL